jgi:hypothetical protein
MGLAASKSVSDMITTIVSNVTNDTLLEASSNIDNTQLISVNNASGAVVIDGNTMTTNLNVNLEATLNAINDADIKQDMQDKISQASKSLIKDINIGNIGTAQAHVTCLERRINRLL